MKANVTYRQKKPSFVSKKSEIAITSITSIKKMKTKIMSFAEYKV